MENRIGCFYYEIVKEHKLGIPRWLTLTVLNTGIPNYWDHLQALKTADV